MKPRALVIVIAVGLVLGGLVAWAALTPYGGEEAPHHNPFDELHDTFEWTISHLQHIVIPLPHSGNPSLDPRREEDKVIIFRGISKFMLLELIAAALVAVIYIRLAKRVQTGAPPSGAWDNFFEGILTFIRDDVARPNLGEHDADKYTPLLWTLFLFILFNNLLGMIPYFGSPTANLYVTGALALCAFIAMHGAPVVKMGAIKYVKSLWPHIEVGHGLLARAFSLVLCIAIFLIELSGTVIKSGVLAVRLFANMFAGHTVLAMILAFVVTAVGASAMIWGLVTGASVLGVIALSLLQ